MSTTDAPRPDAAAGITTTGAPWLDELLARPPAFVFEPAPPDPNDAVSLAELVELAASFPPPRPSDTAEVRLARPGDLIDLVGPSPATRFAEPRAGLPGLPVFTDDRLPRGVIVLMAHDGTPTVLTYPVPEEPAP